MILEWANHHGKVDLLNFSYFSYSSRPEGGAIYRIKCYAQECDCIRRYRSFKWEEARFFFHIVTQALPGRALKLMQICRIR